MDDPQQKDFVVVFALPIELAAFLQYFPTYEKTQSSLNELYHLKVEKRDGRGAYRICAFALPRMGNYEATLATSRAIDVWRPRHVILGGIAGGVKQDDFKLGDLLIAEEVIAYEPGKETEHGTERRFRTIRPAEELVQLAKQLPIDTWALKSKVERPDGKTDRIIPKVRFGVVVSGEKVISRAGWAKEIKADLKSKLGTPTSLIAGVEMEGYGVALAAYRAETLPGMLMAKAICDWADGQKNDTWQKYAAHVSASFIAALIANSKFDPGQQYKPAIRLDKRKFNRRSKIELCKRMGDDWEDLADWYDIGNDRRRRFQTGRECQAIWDYLENRGDLGSLPEAFKGIDREDLIQELIPLKND